MNSNCTLSNQGCTVVVRGIAYDFPDVRMADAFVQAVEAGAVPPQEASLLLNLEHCPGPADH